MRGMIQLLVFLAIVFFAARFAAEQKADAMVDVASSMARDGRYEEAFAKLDTVQSWFGWTEAADRVEEERKVIRQELASEEEEAEWQEFLAEGERRRQEERERRLEEERRLELQRQFRESQERSGRSVNGFR